ncbi:hypothetical protein [Winogradskyella forsetii]|uniref:hypothetical protein n=1 Tax=Winogradskyella forsetii TaxID=2686077 RepID=UPI0015BE50E3|nr:hypothetical protein [Winogradskyella forsetii]
MKNYIYLVVFAFLLVNCSSEDDTTDPNNIAPGPFSVTILETRIDGASIEWTEAIDIDDDPVTYSIYLNNQLISIGDTSLAHNFTGLEPETIYDGTIVADDGRGGISEDDFSFVTEPELIILNLEPTFWIRDSFPEGEGTRFVYGNGFVVPKNEDASSYQIEIIDYRFDDYPYFVGNIYTWTNESQGDDITFVPGENSFRILLTGVSVNTVNENYADYYNNVIGVTGEAEVLVNIATD